MAAKFTSAAGTEGGSRMPTIFCPRHSARSRDPPPPMSRPSHQDASARSHHHRNKGAYTFPCTAETAAAGRRSGHGRDPPWRDHRLPHRSHRRPPRATRLPTEGTATSRASSAAIATTVPVASQGTAKRQSARTTTAGGGNLPRSGAPVRRAHPCTGMSTLAAGAPTGSFAGWPRGREVAPPGVRSLGGSQSKRSCVV